MVRALVSHTRGHWFKSSTAHNVKPVKSSYWLLLYKHMRASSEYGMHHATMSTIYVGNQGWLGGILYIDRTNAFVMFIIAFSIPISFFILLT